MIPKAAAQVRLSTMGKALAETNARFSEGFGTADVKAAESLLAMLR
jgi:hypothetical protein